MDTVVLYSEGIEPESVEFALPATQVLTCHTKRSLVEHLVDRPDLLGAIIDIEQPDDAWAQFITSVRRSFPMLNVFLLTGGDHDALCGIYPCMNRDSHDANRTARLAVFFAEPRSRNRRHHHRFCWPLTASLDIPGHQCPEDRSGGCGYPVVEISAGGALLEAKHTPPISGSVGTVTIRFQSMRMKTTCTVLPARHASSATAEGFPVRFTGLSMQARAFIDRIVGDALMTVLLDPSQKPEVPAIDTDDELLVSANEFSLAV